MIECPPVRADEIIVGSTCSLKVEMSAFSSLFTSMNDLKRAIVLKEILDKQDPESLDQIQRWTYDYVSKFVKIDPKDAVKMKQELVKECGLTEAEAVELINICPTSLPELRSFTFGWKKLILAETLEKILKIIKEYS